MKTQSTFRISAFTIFIILGALMFSLSDFNLGACIPSERLLEITNEVSTKTTNDISTQSTKESSSINTSVSTTETTYTQSDINATDYSVQTTTTEFLSQTASVISTVTTSKIQTTTTTQTTSTLSTTSTFTTSSTIRTLITTTTSQTTATTTIIQNSILLPNKDAPLEVAILPATQQNVDQHDIVLDDGQLFSTNGNRLLFGHVYNSFSCLSKITVGQQIVLWTDSVPKKYTVTISRLGFLNS